MHNAPAAGQGTALPRCIGRAGEGWCPLISELPDRLRLALAVDVVDQDVLAEALGLGEAGGY
ncbi:MAG TPA: hypothetical protein VLA19_06860 [Herpetosiphonaceae bacterium]|nr:hypothetical protein [Herpetosiphonaceae bacterium]